MRKIPNVPVPPAALGGRPKDTAFQQALIALKVGEGCLEVDKTVGTVYAALYRLRKRGSIPGRRYVARAQGPYFTRIWRLE